MLTGRYSTLWGGCVRERMSAVIVCSSRGMGLTNLRPDESLKAGLEVVDAAVVELGHLIQQLLVFSLKVFPDWSELLSGLRCEKKGRSQKNRPPVVTIQFWPQRPEVMLVSDCEVTTHKWFFHKLKG